MEKVEERPEHEPVKEEALSSLPAEEEEEVQLESKIGKTLSERTTKIVIILVLVMLFLLPVF